MLVGNAGTGKSVLVGSKLDSLDPEKYTIKNVPFNYYTTSAMLQGKKKKKKVCLFIFIEISIISGQEQSVLARDLE